MGTREAGDAEEPNEPFRAIFDSALDAMLLADDAGRYVDANPAALALLDLTLEQLRRTRVHDLSTLPAEVVDGAWAAFLRDGKQEGEFELRRSDGQVVVVEFRAVARVLPSRHLSVLRDVTARRQAEATREQLARVEAEHTAMEKRLAIADRMASVGTLAAGVAHEINNPLAAVIGNLEYLAREIAKAKHGAPGSLPSDLDEPLSDARGAADRIREVVRDLKLFSRPDEERRGLIDVRRAIESSLRMAWNEIRHRARLVKDYGPTPPAYGNDARLGQVFLNLVVNAAHAIPEGDAESNEIRITTRTDDGGGAVIEVRDSGSGIADDDLPRVFEPFFTTKEIGAGTGLGLSICQRIVHELGGTIGVESRLGHGTLFRVLLPPPPADAQIAEVAPIPARALARRGLVLVVDDEPMVVNAILRSLGDVHDVKAVSRASDALRRIDSGERYDVIVCDLMMPQMTGMDLHEELSSRAPDQADRMIFMTGGAFTARARKFLDTVTNQRLEKPFDSIHFRALIDDRVR
ncbi:MAG: response regulator [Labilithrix sp.]|nr:response regulator [Labilithrix sp.]